MGRIPGHPPRTWPTRGLSGSTGDWVALGVITANRSRHACFCGISIGGPHTVGGGAAGGMIMPDGRRQKNPGWSRPGARPEKPDPYALSPTVREALARGKRLGVAVTPARAEAGGQFAALRKLLVGR